MVGIGNTCWFRQSGLKSCREEKSPALFFPSFWFPGNLKGQDTTIQWHLQSRVCNLLKGIDNCLGAAHKAVTSPLDARFDSNNFSLFQLLQLFHFYKQ